MSAQSSFRFELVSLLFPALTNTLVLKKVHNFHLMLPEGKKGQDVVKLDG